MLVAGVKLKVLINEYEMLLLGIILRFPSGPDRIPQRVVAELDFDKFSPSGPNRLIYQAIQKLVIDQQIPTIPNIALTLKDKLDAVGGEPYLQALLAYPLTCGVKTSEGFESYVRLIDNAGRLRQLALVIDKYAKVFEDFEQAVSQIDDVDEFLSSFMAEINAGAVKPKSSYSHISIAVEEEMRRLELESRGYVVDLIPTGWPNLEKYYIPRPGSFGVVSGLSSMGKTQFALQMLLGVAIYLKETGKKGCVAINELETQGWRLNRRMACCLAGIDSSELARGSLSKHDLDRYYKTLEYISTLPIYYDDNAMLTSQQMAWQALALNIEKGPRVLGVADYAELFADTGASEELRVSGVVRSQRRIAWETGSCEIMISQLNSSVMQTNTKIGGMSRTRYSGAIAQAADWFVEIYNPPQMRRAQIDFVLPDAMDERMAYVLIEKNKDYPVGQEPFEWIPQYTRFRDVSLKMGQVYRPVSLEQEDF